jgi:hypothetical protein
MQVRFIPQASVAQLECGGALLVCAAGGPASGAFRSGSGAQKKFLKKIFSRAIK